MGGGSLPSFLRRREDWAPLGAEGGGQGSLSPAFPVSLGPEPTDVQEQMEVPQLGGECRCPEASGTPDHASQGLSFPGGATRERPPGWPMGTHYLIRQRGHWLWAPVGGRPALALGDRDAVAAASGEGVDGGGRRKGGRGREGKGRRGSSWKRDLHFVRSCE